VVNGGPAVRMTPVLMANRERGISAPPAIITLLL